MAVNVSNDCLRCPVAQYYLQYPSGIPRIHPCNGIRPLHHHFVEFVALTAGLLPASQGIFTVCFVILFYRKGSVASCFSFQG